MCFCYRRLYLGDSDARGETIPRDQELRRDWEAGERRTAPVASELPAPAVLADVAVLVVRTAQATQLQEHQGGAIVSIRGRTVICVRDIDGWCF